MSPFGKVIEQSVLRIGVVLDDKRHDGLRHGPTGDFEGRRRLLQVTGLRQGILDFDREGGTLVIVHAHRRTGFLNQNLANGEPNDRLIAVSGTVGILLVGQFGDVMKIRRSHRDQNGLIQNVAIETSIVRTPRCSTILSALSRMFRNASSS